MLKRLAIFGMLLVVLCTYCCADQIQAKQGNQKPTTPVSAIPNQQHDGATFHGEPPEHDVRADVKIVNPPEKDFYDKAPVWINLALVVIALGTGIVIGWQAWETRKAAEATEISAKGAMESGEAFINAERAWILVETGNIPDDFEPDPQRIQIFEIWPVVINRGRTAGRVTRGFIGKLDVPSNYELPPEPDYSSKMGDANINFVLAPGTAVQPMRISVSLWDFIKFRRSERKLYIYGFVTYSDVGKQIRESRFCFIYNVPSGFTSQSRGFYQAIDVPAAYTRCT